MTTRLYLTPLPNKTADRAGDETRSIVQQTGLIDKAGTAVENVATDSVDLTIRGRIQYGETLSRKLARELTSLSESTITSLPLIGAPVGSLDTKSAYYELERATVTPAHPVTERAFEYQLGLTFVGTRADSLRNIGTTIEPLTTPFATGSAGQIAIPAAARRTQWYSKSGGEVNATPVSTETAEFGDVLLFDPSTAPYDDPRLIYDLPFESEGVVDARVFDDRDGPKFVATGSDTPDVNQWIHAYHTSYEFDGQPVLDTGRLRIFLDVANDRLTAEEYNPTADDWDPVNITMGDFALRDYSFLRIGPAGATVRLVLEDTTDGSESSVEISARRGKSRLLVRPIVGESILPSVQDVFDTVASDQTTDPNPVQSLVAREDL